MTKQIERFDFSVWNYGILYEYKTIKHNKLMRIRNTLSGQVIDAHYRIVKDTHDVILLTPQGTKLIKNCGVRSIIDNLNI